MKAAVIVCRNDNYGDNLHHWARLCLDNLTAVFDTVFIVDWKCVQNTSLIEALDYKSKNVVNIKITRDIIAKQYNHLSSLPLVEVIGRNIGIRQAIANGFDWICSTNIDIISNPFNELALDKDTLYTVRKYTVPEDIHLKQPITLDFLNQNKHLFSLASMAVVDGQAVWDPGDIWSLVTGCGDFQLAHKTLWMAIKGFEEEMIGRTYADSNIMKKPILIGKKTAILDLDLYHLNHSSNAYRESDEIKIPVNDRIKWVNNFIETKNNEDWGVVEFS